MKLSISFKTAGALDDLMNVAIKEYDKTLSDKDDDDRSMALDDYREEIKEKLSSWIKFGELIAVEFDLEKNTAIVIKPC